MVRGNKGVKLLLIYRIDVWYDFIFVKYTCVYINREKIERKKLVVLICLGFVWKYFS